MSHYNNVQVILDAVVDQEYSQFENALYQSFGDNTIEPDEFFRSLVFVLSRLWGGTTWQFKKEFRERLTNETVEEEIDLLFWEEADDEQAG